MVWRYRLDKPQTSVGRAGWTILVRVWKTRMLVGMWTVKARPRKFQLGGRTFGILIMAENLSIFGSCLTGGDLVDETS